MRNRHAISSLLAACFAVGLSASIATAQVGTGGTGATTGGGTGVGGTGVGGTGVGGTGVGGTGVGGTGVGGTDSGIAVPSTLATTSQQTVQSSTTGTGSATSIPSNTNPIVSTYMEPRSAGLPSSFANNIGARIKPIGTFGVPLYAATTTTTTTVKSAGTNTAAGFNTYGTIRAPVYSTSLAPDIPMVVHRPADLQVQLQAAVARSTRLKNRQNIQVTVIGDQTVRLVGQVESERERRLAGDMLSLTPGVRVVDNQLVVVPAGN